jgi:hypothetical protein
LEYIEEGVGMNDGAEHAAGRRGAEVFRSLCSHAA